MTSQHNPPLPPWRLQHRTFHFQTNRPLLMGIVNVTPDSFFDGGQYFSPQYAIEHALQLIEEGADILDIGGESTRPGALPISVEQECARILPVIEALRAQTTTPISVDTTKSAVAAQALQAGAEILNDVSCMRFDPQLAHVAAQHKAYLIVMHSRHTPENMQHQPFYQDLWGELLSELQTGVDAALQAGVPRTHIAVDPGIGFGKRLQDNVQILRELQQMQSLGYPILIGASRKSFIHAIHPTPPQDRLEGSLAAAAVASMHGAHFLRVHDIKETKRFLHVFQHILEIPTQENR